MTSARIEAATQSADHEELLDAIFDLSVQMQIEGYEKLDPKRPIQVQKGN